MCVQGRCVLLDALQICPLYMYVCVVTVYMYVYIHCVFNRHCNSSCLLHFDVVTELRFVCIGITGLVGCAMGGKCPLSISVHNNSLDFQETVHLACEWGNCVYVWSAVVQTKGPYLSGLLLKLKCLISVVQFAPSSVISRITPVCLHSQTNRRR